MIHLAKQSDFSFESLLVFFVVEALLEQSLHCPHCHGLPVDAPVHLAECA